MYQFVARRLCQNTRAQYGGASIKQASILFVNAIRGGDEQLRNNLILFILKKLKKRARKDFKLNWNLFSVWQTLSI